MRTIYMILLCIALAGCQKSTQEPVSDAPERESKALSAKTIGEPEARSLISDFVNAQLVGKTFVDAGNQTHRYPKIEPTHWRVVELKDGRWIAKLDPPDGVWATASVDENGKNPKIEGYGFAPQ